MVLLLINRIAAMQRPRMMVSVSRVASGRFMACSVAWTDWVFQYECETAISSSLWVDGEVCELSGYNLTVGSHYAYYD
jgi:hypothetical protein